MPVTDVDKNIDALTMTITAEFNSDAERLWELWSDPHQLEAWWSPPSHSSTFVEHELRVGARTTYFMTGPDGEKHHGCWRIEEVEPPHRLHITDDAVDDEGKPEDGGPTAMTVTIAEADALKRAHAALDRLESEWRGRIGRIDSILDDDKGDS